MAKPREGYHDFFLQIPDAIWDALNAEAKKESRTATGQLIHLLRWHYGIEAVPPPKKRGPKPRRRPT